MYGLMKKEVRFVLRGSGFCVFRNFPPFVLYFDFCSNLSTLYYFLKYCVYLRGTLLVFASPPNNVATFPFK